MKRLLLSLLLVLSLTVLLASAAMAADIVFPAFDEDGDQISRTIVMGPQSKTITVSINSDKTWYGFSAFCNADVDRWSGTANSMVTIRLLPVSGDAGMYSEFMYHNGKKGRAWESFGHLTVVQLSAADYARYQAMHSCTNFEPYFTLGTFDESEGPVQRVALERFWKDSGKNHALVSKSSYLECGECERYIYATLFGQPSDAADRFFGTEAHSFSGGVCTLCGQAEEIKAKKMVVSTSAREIMVGGEPVSLTPIFSPSNANAEVYYTSSDTSAATVDIYGMVTAIDAGAKGSKVVTITCEPSSGKKVKVKLTVVAKDSVHSLSLYAPKTLPLMLGSEPYRILPKVLPQDVDAKITWESSVPGIATVDSQGVVTPVAVLDGKKKFTVITATTENGKKASVKVTVMEPASKAALVLIDIAGRVAPSSLVKAMYEEEITLCAKSLPSGAMEAGLWKSTNTKVATVDNGVVKFIAPGKTTISCKVGKLTAKLVIQII